MRDYGKIYTAFWTSEDVRQLSEDGRLLALYLLACPHGNMIGCFRLTDAYAADDIKWPIERVSKAFAELVSKGYAYRCDRTSWVFINRFLKWNQFENPNVGKAAGKLFESITPPYEVKAMLGKALREFSPTFPVAILDKFAASGKPFQYPSTLSTETAVAVAAVTAATTGANPTVEQKQLDLEKLEAEEKAIRDAEEKARLEDEEKARSATEVEAIFAYWQKTMDSPKSVLDTNRRGVIARALKNYSPADVCKAIRGCSKSPHNMGQNDRKEKYNGLELILRNAEKIDRFIGLDAGNARAFAETVDERNARVMAEFLDETDDSNTIEMEHT